jgi:hypothetical protein
MRSGAAFILRCTLGDKMRVQKKQNIGRRFQMVSQLHEQLADNQVSLVNGNTISHVQSKAAKTF